MATDESKRITAYNMKTKQSNVPIHNATINRVASGARISYSVKGFTEDGTQTLAAMTSKVKAEEAIAAGVATKGEGWD